MSRSGSIFLIGPMGAGKSTIGRYLAEILSKEFQDTDHEIEQRTGASISLIFEIEGEDGFRRREAAVLDELTSRDNLVLATGGGAILSEQNRQMLRTRGTVVYLSAPIDTLLARTHRDRNRPLLQDSDRRATFEQIMRSRDAIYRDTADVVVTTDQRSPQNVAQDIADKLRGLKSHANAQR